MQKKKSKKVNIKLKLAVVGDQGAGKSSLINYLVGRPFSAQYLPDEQCSVLKHQFQTKDALYTIQFWECGSNHFQKNQYLRRGFFHNVTAVIVVYDLSADNILQSLPKWVDQSHVNNCFLIYAFGTKRDVVQITMQDKDFIDKIVRQCKVNSQLYSAKQKKGQNLQKVVKNVLDQRNKLHQSICTKGEMYCRRTFQH